MDKRYPNTGVTRRGLLLAGTSVTAGLGVVSAGPVSAQEDAYGGYLAQEGTWEQVTVDATSRDSVTVTVGAKGNDGFLAFDPAAVAVAPDSTVQWEWTGEGGAHNVVHDVPQDDRRFSSLDTHEGTTVSEEGFSYETTFEESTEGGYRYYCSPHSAQQMKGVVVVGEENIETETVPIEEYERAATSQDGDGSGPGFGAVTGLVGLGGAVALRRRLRADSGR